VSPHTGTDILGRVIAHVLDEISDRPHVLIEGIDGVVYYLPHDASIAEARANGKLPPNAFVQLHKAGAPVWTVRDFGDADRLLTSGDAFRTALILDQPTCLSGQGHWSGWLGRYWATRNREAMIASMAIGIQSSHLQRRHSARAQPRLYRSFAAHLEWSGEGTTVDSHSVLKFAGISHLVASHCRA
jgi:hypothetical protein